MRYHEIAPISRDEAAETFRSGTTEAICSSLVSIAFYDPDWRWVQEQCVCLSEYPNSAVRSVAGLCFGHLARIHRELDLEVVMPVLQQLARDPETRGQAEDALSDIAIFIQRRR